MILSSMAKETRRWCATCSTANAPSAVDSGTVGLQATWCCGAEARVGGGALGNRPDFVDFVICGYLRCSSEQTGGDSVELEIVAALKASRWSGCIRF